jgi:scyllo-inositol 2-dehydrogenase (NADP+)
MSSTTPIRTGIIGYGLAGRVFHAPFIETNPDFSLDLIATGNPERQAHLAQGLAALEGGAAVVVDKPFVPSVIDAKKLIAASEETGNALIVFQNRRWDGDFLTVKKLVDEGALGDVHRFESTFERWGRAKPGLWQETTTIDEGAGITFDLRAGRTAGRTRGSE